MNMNILIVLLMLIVSFMNTWLHGFPIHTLQWRHNERDGVPNHQPHHCLLNRLFRCRSKKTSKLRVTGLCAGNSPVTGEFPAQMASDAENVSIWRRHHEGVFAFVYIQANDTRHPRVLSRVMNYMPRPACHNLCLNQVLFCPGRRKG